MFSAHLVFGDIDHSSDFDIVERAGLIDSFHRLCELNKPNLNEHSFFSVDNDSIMIGFSNLEGFYSGNDVLIYVLKLKSELKQIGINVSFGVNLIACVPEINWATYPGILNDTRLIYMPDNEYETLRRIQRERLTGDPLIVVARVLEIAKKTGKPICYAITNGGHFNDFFNTGQPITPRRVIGWQQVIPPDHSRFLRGRQISDIYYLD